MKRLYATAISVMTFLALAAPALADVQQMP